MTLEEAIIHCKEKACGNTQCALEHRQLVEWLEELKEYRKNAKRGNKMKAPNKIYVPILPRIENSIISEHCVGTAWDNKEHITIPDIEEYIRKDALQEIIETARESAIVQRNFNNCPVEQEARIDAYDYIKHKIESL